MLAYVFLFVCLSLRINAESNTQRNPTIVECNEMGDCISNEQCYNKCGCDSAAAVLFYNETAGECVVDVKRLLQNLSDKSNTREKLHQDVERVFQGIIFAAILFASCAAVCALTACVYCFRINYMDTRLRNDVDALASKLKRDYRYKKMSTKQPTKPGSESCNIIVEEAGVFVV